MNNETNIRLFKQIAEGFNLTEGEVAKTLQLSPQGLKNAIKDCFRQIEQPREKFSAEDYKYLTEELGCVNLEEQLEDEPLSPYASINNAVASKAVDMPIKFTRDDMLIAVYLMGFHRGKSTEHGVDTVLDLLAHPKVKYLIKNGEYYSLNLNAKIG